MYKCVNITICTHTYTQEDLYLQSQLEPESLLSVVAVKQDAHVTASLNNFIIDTPSCGC